MKLTTPLFTPTLNGQRVKLENVTWIEGHIRRGRGKYGVIETESGKRYEVYGASCGIPNCMCDARIREVKP